MTDEIADALASLPVGTYTMTVDNYRLGQAVLKVEGALIIRLDEHGKVLTVVPKTNL